METVKAVQKVVSSLSLSLLEENLKKGRSIFIPSLGIEIKPEDYFQSEKDGKIDGSEFTTGS